VKVYDKASVLRVETTINNPREFKVWRSVTDDAGQSSRRWMPMRKSVADMWRNYHREGPDRHADSAYDSRSQQLEALRTGEDLHATTIRQQGFHDGSFARRDEAARSWFEGASRGSGSRGRIRLVTATTPGTWRNKATITGMSQG
jgi:hypothetical protein